MRSFEFDESVNTGGHRLSNNDIYQLHIGLEQLGQVFGSSFGTPGTGGLVVSGVKETTTVTDISYTGGWLYHQGVMWKVNPMAAQTLTAGNTIYFVYQVKRNYTPVSYQSGAVFQPHIEREVDIVYTTSSDPAISGGTLNVDHTLPFYVRFERIEDIINRVAANTAHRELVANAVWAELDGTSIANSLILAGNIPNGVGSNSRVRYKMIGKQLYLQVSLILTAPSPSNFSVKLPNGIDLRNVLQPSILALDSQNTTQPCAVEFVAGTGNNPSVMNFSRGHNNTAQDTVSFSTVLELA